MDTNLVIMVAASLIGLVIVTLAALSGWRGWLALKATEVERATARDVPTNAINARIDVADLKERLRKLEAIAAGVEL